jgi:hypothetical protein
MIVAEAATTPDVSLKIDFVDLEEELSDENYDEDLNFEDYYGAPVYKATATLIGAAKKASVKENGTTVAYTGCFIDSIQAAWTYSSTSDDLLVVNKAANLSGTLSKAENGELTVAWSTAEDFVKAEQVVYTWYFIAEDMSAIEDITIKVNPAKDLIVKVNQYWDGTSKTAQENVVLRGVDAINFVDYGVAVPPQPPVEEKTVWTSADDASIPADKQIIADVANVTGITKDTRVTVSNGSEEKTFGNNIFAYLRANGVEIADDATADGEFRFAILAPIGADADAFTFSVN